MTAAPPSDPNIFCSSPIAKRATSYPANYQAQQQHVPSFLSGNLGTLAPPCEGAMSAGQNVSETLFSVGTDLNKSQLDTTMILVDRVKQLMKILNRPVGNDEAAALQHFLISTFNRQAYKSNLTGPDTFFGTVSRFVPHLASLDPQKAANELRKQLTKNVVKNKDFAEVIIIVRP